MEVFDASPADDTEGCAEASAASSPAASAPLPLRERAYWVAFSRVRGIGPASFKKLLTFFQNDLAAAWQAGREELLQAGLPGRLVESFLMQRTAIEPEREMERLRTLRIQALTLRDRQYPLALRKQTDAPPVLYVRGCFSQDDQFALAIVGTRRMSLYGKLVTERFAAELARHGVTIVSGLAIGVDATAHQAALDAGGRTIAVLACGLDVLYPSANGPLARRIVESGQGLLLSEYPPGIYPDGGNFPARNRIISGLTLGVLVTEAPRQSGALITARHALESGRDVFAVPGNMFASGSEGANRLIQDGARLVTSVGDILEALNLFMIPACLEVQSALPENAAEEVLLRVLDYEPRHIDEVIRRSGLPAQSVSATLLTMELKGMIKQVGGMYYVLARPSR
jgi:DNA processing protein